MYNLNAPINPLGYGVFACNIIKVLSDLGIDICLNPIGQVQNDPYFESYWKRAADRFSTGYNKKNPTLFLFHDEYSHQCSGTPVYTLSMFETTLLKIKSKLMLMNGPTDIVLTTTKRHKELLINNGITKPIEILHGGIDPALYNTFAPNKRIDTHKFTFITAGKRELRKNTDLILNTFIDNFKDQDVALIAHTFNGFINNTGDHPFKNLTCWSGVNPIKSGFEYKGCSGNAHKFVYKNCEIYFTLPNIMVTEMPCLYHSANVGIYYSRAEGWGLPYSESLACGLPCIATDCLGHSEFITEIPEHKDLIVPITEECIAMDGQWFKGEEGNWGKPDPNILKEKMLYVFNNQDKYLNKSQAISDYMSTYFSWAAAADSLVRILRSHE